MNGAQPVPHLATAVAPPVAWWLRLEGLAAATLSAVLYARIGAHWWLFSALWLSPDLSMIGYLAGPRVGSHCYNAVHSYLPPVAITIAALLLPRPALLPFA